jgi:hypothetical protein
MLNDQLFTAANNATNQSSSAIDTSFILWVSFQLVVTGSSPNGTIKLQCSNDKPPAYYTPASFLPTNWNDIPNTTVSVSATGTYVIPKTEISYQWVRAVWTHSSGTGTITGNLKSVGA